ncbi:LuxR C-terminal-related transcriptional regulator [Streptomyces acidiscabies]|uniref:helix-turn-helix transcriptional regulator n=1 Tax=Streptomyces acidiscabies TaxID=42234 RepID=UPI0038F7B69D
MERVNLGIGRAQVAEEAEGLLSPSAPSCPCPYGTWAALMALLYAGDLLSVDAHVQRLARDPEWTRSARREAVLELVSARALHVSGDASRTVDVLAGVAARSTSARTDHLVIAWLVEALVDTGDLDRAQRTLLEHDLSGRLEPGTPDRAPLLAARAALHRATGRFGQAIDDYLACGRLLGLDGVINPAVIPWRSGAAFGALAARRYDLALALAEDELIAARKWGSPRGIATALHSVAVARRDDTSVPLLEDAVRLLSLGCSGTALMHALYDLASLRIGQGDTAVGRGHLEAVGATARKYRNAHWAERARWSLDRLDAPAGLSALTPQEERTAQLARAGYSNRQIAETLFVTVRTVEFHLSSVYRKLSISGRGELVTALNNVTA